MGYKVKIIADSISKSGQRLTTFELEYPRIILAELNTHRVFSKSSASSRAIPGMRMIKLTKANPFIPFYWGKNQPGMAADNQLIGWRLRAVKNIWNIGISLNLFGAYMMNFLGLHKQLANRNIEYCSYMKTIVTSTDFSNFLELRDHPAAQPEIQQLARRMRLALQVSTPELLHKGEWHTPYVDHERDANKELKYYVNSTYLTVNEAKKVSVSCCAQTSYRRQDTSIAKAINICHKLAGAKPIHASPFEAVATPAPSMMPSNGNIFSMGITGYNTHRVPLSGNFAGWIQYRHCLDEIQMSNLND